MEKKQYERLHKEDKPVVTICYDFDKTLTPKDMQSQGFIQFIGYDPESFWKESNALAENNDMDQNLAYMYRMIEESEGKQVFTRARLNEYGERISFYDGVEDWFDRINKYGEEKDVLVEHYIISSGLKEMIEGTSIAKKGVFKKIYASSFLYNEKGVAIWPTQVINYTNKTQFLFRIEKGVVDINDQSVNDRFDINDIRVPFWNMVYIGDSGTDIPCMELLSSKGGHSICVYDQDKASAYKMVKDSRVNYFAPADYTENSELDKLIKAIIINAKTTYDMDVFSDACYDDIKSNNCVETKNDLLVALHNSHSFLRTHELVGKLKEINDELNADDILYLMMVACENSQIFYILGNDDIRNFYLGFIKDKKELNYYEKRVKEACDLDYKENMKKFNRI